MATKKSFNIDQGSHERISFVLRDKSGLIDLNGFTAAMEMRVSAFSEEAIDTLTTENGRLVIDAAGAKITAIFPHEITEKYTARRAVYDLEIESPDGVIKRVVEGEIKICPEVTRVKCKR